MVKNIFITGGCGFIGSNFINFLFKGIKLLNEKYPLLSD